MCVNKALDDLIEAGWQVIESDFDPDAFVQWRKRALDCVAVLMGEDHPYTQFFDEFVSREVRDSLLTGAGILEATKEQLSVRGSTADHSDFQLRSSIQSDSGNA